MRGRTRGGATGANGTARWATAALLLAVAASARAATVSIEDGPVVLGRTTSASALIELDEGADAGDVPLRLSVNAGSFSDVVRVGPGRYRAVYAPPATRFPQVALVAVWRDTGPDAPVVFLRLPLLGVTRVPVTARPGARVRVRVEASTFGPVVADRRGRAEVPVVVSPGVDRCEVTVRERSGAETTRRVPLHVPTYNRLTAVVVPHSAVADGRSEVRLDVLYDLAGADVPPERIRVAPSVGAVTLERAARGLHSYRYVPPAGATATSVSFDVSVAGDPAARVAALLALTPPPIPPPTPHPVAPPRPQPPARVVVTAPAEPLRAASGAEAALDVLVLDGAGAGVPGLEVSATANGEPLPPPVPRGDGHYALRYAAPATPPPGGLVQIEAVAHHPDGFAFGSLAWRLEPGPAPRVVVPRLLPSPVPADGRTAARVLLEVRDAAGAPVEGADLVTAATHGTLGKLRERGNGLYEQTYVAPAGLPDGGAVLRVADGAGRFERTFPIPLRPAAGRLLAGLAAAYARSPGVASGPRAAADVWVPFRVGALRLGAGATVGLGVASHTVSDASGALRSTTTATFVPVALKLGWELPAGPRLSLAAGAGPLAAWARFHSSLASGAQQGGALGWAAFADAGWAIGPGVAVLGLSYGSATVSTADYRLDPGGPAVTAGYRVRLF